jgi:phosphoserine aminotransferase
LLGENQGADYINTGSWSKKAIDEAQKLGKKVNVIASSEQENFNHIPDNFNISPDAAYVHITSNNTIFGTQWAYYPDTSSIPLVCDMSSDIACRPVNVGDFGLIYAGAQKNIGPAGVTLVILREDLLNRSPENIPTMTNYKIIGGKDSLYNTPPTFAVYVVNLMFEWIKKEGGLIKIGEVNKQKAQILYEIIDTSGFYRGTAQAGSRSIMNVTFRMPSEELEKRFVEEATNNGMIGLKGHRSVGGIRASIYNAVSLNSVKVLSQFMKDFEEKNG